jgi:hypothetical protein
MADFPSLKTGAVMQYPATKSLQYSTQVMRFLDGAEQSYRDFPGVLRRWVIRLDLLEEFELRVLEQFFISEQGRFGSFTFTDPRDGAQYPDCSLDEDAFELALLGEMRGQTRITVRENRS